MKTTHKLRLGESPNLNLYRANEKGGVNALQIPVWVSIDAICPRWSPFLEEPHPEWKTFNILEWSGSLEYSGIKSVCPRPRVVSPPSSSIPSRTYPSNRFQSQLVFVDPFILHHEASCRYPRSARRFGCSGRGHVSLVLSPWSALLQDEAYDRHLLRGQAFC